MLLGLNCASMLWVRWAPRCELSEQASKGHPRLINIWRGNVPNPNTFFRGRVRLRDSVANRAIDTWRGLVRPSAFLRRPTTIE
jgi:hypothetical protein